MGNPGSPWEAVVDPAGLVTPRPDSWSVDWWVGARGQWILPGQLPAPEQRLLDRAPVVETVVHTTDSAGDTAAVKQRVSAAEHTEGELVVIEVDNETDGDVDIAFALRSYNPEGSAVVEDVLVEQDRIVADGIPAMLLPQPAGRVAASTYLLGDTVHAVKRAAVGVLRAHPVTVHDPAGPA